MATVAHLTPSRFGTSMSLSGSQTTSMVESLPAVDFGFDELRARMNAFTARFDDFIARGRKRVLDERSAFRMSAAELQEVQRVRRLAVIEFEQKSNNHADTIAKEAQETYELQTAIEALRQENEDRKQRRAELLAEANRIQLEIKQEKEACQAQQAALDEQARHDLSELQAWETLLGLRIEGAQVDTEKLRFVFTDVDMRDRTREAWFEMDLADASHDITATRPVLPKEDVARLQQDFRQERDIAALLKGMRSLFVRALQS